MRRRALGGIVGPVGFVIAWAVNGARTTGYSPVEDAISRLAAADASTRLAMTAGFVAFGVGVPVYALALRDALPGRAWIAAVAAGIAILGVAAVPLDWSPAYDTLHGAFATGGYVALAATPALAARPLARAGCTRWARASVLAATISGACLAGTVAGPAPGLLQRTGLLAGDVWIVATALAILTRGRFVDAKYAACGSRR